MGLQEFLEASHIIRGPDGRSAHILARYGELNPYAITCGPPERIKLLRTLLDNTTVVSDNRGLLVINGNYEGVPICGVASGMGSSSMSIVFPEWFFNVDLANYPTPTMIRVGTAGSWQEYVNLNDLVISTGIVRDDGASRRIAHLEVPALVDIPTTLCLIQAVEQIGYPHRVHMGPTICKDNLYADEDPHAHSAIPHEISQRQEAYRTLGALATSMEESPPSILAEFYRAKAREYGVNLNPAYACCLVIVSPPHGEEKGVEIKYDPECEMKALRIALEALRLKSQLDQGNHDVLEPELFMRTYNKALSNSVSPNLSACQ